MPATPRNRQPRSQGEKLIDGITSFVETPEERESSGPIAQYCYIVRMLTQCFGGPFDGTGVVGIYKARDKKSPCLEVDSHAEWAQPIGLLQMSNRHLSVASIGTQHAADRQCIC